MPRKYITGELKQFIIEQFAGFEKPAQIREMVQAKFDIDIPIKTIRTIKKRNREEIAEARERLKKQIDKIPIANVFWRIKQRQELLEDLKNKGLWDEDGNPRHLLVNKILDGAAEEFKIVLNMQVDNSVTNVLNMTIDDFKKFIRKDMELESGDDG